MAFRDFPFPPSTILYPPHSVVLQYLQDYAKVFNLEEHIHFSTTVTNAERGGKWVVHTEVTNLDGSKKTVTLADVDSLLVSNGRCAHPFLPSLPGLQLWLSSGKAHHSISYREPSPYTNKRVVVVGNGPSGVDMAPEIATVAKKVYQSTRSPRTGNKSSEESLKSTTGTKEIEFCAAIESFGDMRDGKVNLVDGTVLGEIDRVVLATGYRIHCAFLQPPVIKKGYPPSVNEDGTCGDSENFLYNSGNHVFPLARHLFPIHPSLPLGSLFFFGLPRRIVPFPVTEAQALVISSILSDSATIDIKAEVKAVKNREMRLREIFDGDVKEVAVEWHILPDDLQFGYREQLVTLAGLNSEVGKQVPDWQRRVYIKKRPLQAAWKEIVKNGEGEEVCKGVGTGGEEEWVELMDRLIQRSESPAVEGIVKENEVHL
jgi:hypothetical protein